MKGRVIVNDSRKYVRGVTQQFGQRKGILVEVEEVAQ